MKKTFNNLVEEFCRNTFLGLATVCLTNIQSGYHKVNFKLVLK